MADRRFKYGAWSGAAHIVEADNVFFEPGYVTFWDYDDAVTDERHRLVLAVRDVDCNNLREVTGDSNG